VSNSADPPSDLEKALGIPSPPAPDTREGRALVYGLVVGLSFTLLLLAEATPLANVAGQFIAIPLILGVIAAFGVGSLLASEGGRIRLAQLELARTVSVHDGSDEMPTPDSPLGTVLRQYVLTIGDFRRSARSHAYAAGPIVWGTVLAFAAAVLWGLGLGTGTLWLVQLGLVAEIPALTLLTVGFSILGTGVGIERSVAGFAALTPRRWRHFQVRNPPLEGVILGCSWLREVNDGMEGATSAPFPSTPEAGVSPLVTLTAAGGRKRASR